MCDICLKEEVKHTYVLNDNSKISLCDECGAILYMKNIHYNFMPYDRLFQIIAMIEYVDIYKQKVLKR